MAEFIFRERVSGVGERLFNNPFTRETSDGRRYRPTRMELPSWVTRNTMTEGVDNLVSSIDFSVERISSRRPIDVLLDSPLFPDISKEFRADNLVEEFREMAPSDGVEMVDWMHQSAAETAVLTGWAEEYNRNSLVNVDAGDPTAPHDLIGVPDINFDPTPGRQVNGSSATMRLPNRNVQIPDGTGQLVVDEDLIGAGSVKADKSYQWNGKVAQFRELAKTPIEEPVRFPELSNFNLPNVFDQAPPGSAEAAKVTFNLSSNTNQDVRIAFRNPNDYTQRVAEQTVNVPEGTSQVEFELASSPEVPPLVTEMEALGGGVQSIESYSLETA